MAGVMIMQFPPNTVGPDKYEAIMKELGITTATPNRGDVQGTWPKGAISHTSGFPNGSLCFVGYWESLDHFDDIYAGRLGAALKKLGFPEPTITKFDIYLHIPFAEIAWGSAPLPFPTTPDSVPPSR